MTSYKPVSVSLLSAGYSISKNFGLIYQMAKRDVVGRYKGSFFGLLWSFFSPLLMLGVYTFVFSVVFKARWGGAESTSSIHFSLLLFSGLLCHGLIGDVLNKSTDVILNNPNFVKKVIFPLEILPAVVVFSALFQTSVSLCVLFVGLMWFGESLHWTFLLTPIILFPLAILCLGCGWFLAALGVYIRDVSQFIGILTTALLFLSPVFFPLEAIPEKYQPIILMNPLTFIIEQVREVALFGRLPNWEGLGYYLGCSSLISWIGFYVFQRTRKGFADVI
jgi:lipopolysaccharide transport system permease protein